MENLRRIIIPYHSEGLDFSYSIDSDNSLKVDYVEHLSYAEKAGLKIGDKIKSINGFLVKNMTFDDIKDVMKNFSRGSLVLTIQPNLINKTKEEIQAKSKTLDDRYMRAGGRPYTRNPINSNTNKASSLKESSVGQRRKINKYTRNMSDVTDNSRFSVSGYGSQHSRRGSSPPSGGKPSPRVSPVLSSDAQSNRRRLELNRVGGLVRTTSPPKKIKPSSNSSVASSSLSSQPSTNAATADYLSRGRRHSKLTFLTCSPMPYRSSSKPRDSTESIDQPCLENSDNHIASRASNEVSQEDNRSKTTIDLDEKSIRAEQESIEEEYSSDEESRELVEQHNYEIEPSICWIMWKYIRDKEISDGLWKKSEICVENGIFKVLKEFNETSVDGNDDISLEDDDEQEEELEDLDEITPRPKLAKNDDDIYDFLCLDLPSSQSVKVKPKKKPDAKPYYFNFDYVDNNSMKWDFSIKFNNTRSQLVKHWIEYFDAHKSQTTPSAETTTTTTTTPTPESTNQNREFPICGATPSHTAANLCRSIDNNGANTPNKKNKSKSDKSRKYTKQRTSQSQILSPNVTAQVLESVQASKAESSKSRLHSALSRVRNFTTRRLTHTDSQSEFKKQQEEWLAKTEPHNFPPEVSSDQSSSAQSATVNVAGTAAVSSGPTGGSQVATVGGFNGVHQLAHATATTTSRACVNVCMDHNNIALYQSHYSTLGLDKWQRSIESPLVPFIVEVCVKVIEKYGRNYVGIYRVSGNKLSLDILNAEFRKPIHMIDLSHDVWNDIYAMSGILKSFLRNLPDGVFPKAYYHELMSAWKSHLNDRDKRLLSLQRMLSILDSSHPEYRHHRETLHYLARHLLHISHNHPVNKMTVKNLAVVFAPTLIRPPQETNEMLMADYKYRIELVENIIQYQEWMFSPSLESACNIPEEVPSDGPSSPDSAPANTSAAGGSGGGGSLEESTASSGAVAPVDVPPATTTSISNTHHCVAPGDSLSDQVDDPEQQQQQDDQQNESSPSSVQQQMSHDDSPGEDCREFIRDLITQVTNMIETSTSTTASATTSTVQPISDVTINNSLSTTANNHTDHLRQSDESGIASSSSTSNLLLLGEPNQYTLIELVPHKLDQQSNNNPVALVPANHSGTPASLATATVKSHLQPPSESFIAEKHSCQILEDNPTANNVSQPTCIDPSSQSSCSKSSAAQSSTHHLIKRPSFKLRKSFKSNNKSSSSNTGGLSHLPKELLLTNKKLCALSVALVTTNSHPLNSPIMISTEHDSTNSNSTNND